MYQTMEEIFGAKKKPNSSNPKDIHVYIWNGRKIHFRGPTEFIDGEKIEVRIDKDNNKLLFMDGGKDKYCKKFVLESKSGSGSLSFKRALDIVDVTGTVSYGVKKLEEQDLRDLNLAVERVAYEIDLNNPLPTKTKTIKTAPAAV